MPATIAQYVLKIAGRCDLACDHCYVYEHADQSWQGKPSTIAMSTVRRAAGRIADHAVEHRIPDVHLVLHGGEPLLLGHHGLRETLAALRTTIDPVTRLHLRLHTNGVRLDERFCELFAEYRVGVGVSLDGDRTANDLHRRFRDGRSSHSQVGRALALLRTPAYRQLYSGLLCTIDLRNDPLAVYEALLAEAPPRLDLLLPHATWDRPPFRPPGVPAPYADWLGRIYTRWTADGCPVPIRFFDSLLSAAAGGPSLSEAVGPDPVDLLVIETNGEWEQADSLKTAHPGAPETGMNVHEHSVDQAAAHPDVAGRQGGVEALCPTCRACPVVRICGGGLYAHRYRTGSRFDNPSVYCTDLKQLIALMTTAPTGPAPTGVAGGTVRPRRSPEQPVDTGPTFHTLPAGSFEAFAAGPGDVAGMTALTDMWLSVNRAMVASVAAASATGAGETDASAGGRERETAQAGWELLCALDGEHPDSVHAILTAPFTRAWAARCLRPPAHVDTSGGSGTALDRAHLAGLAAAAALHAGVRPELELPVRDGCLYVPTLGGLRVNADGRTGARLPRSALDRILAHQAAGKVAGAGRADRHEGERHEGDRHEAKPWEEPAGPWLPVRTLDAAPLSFAVDDIDPFRSCEVPDVTGRLPPARWSLWSRALTEAATALGRELPGYADVMRIGLKAVVPLLPHASAHGHSATARHAPGAVCVALPPATDLLGELIVHEFQHVKLYSLLELHDLVDVTYPVRSTVPWHSLPRPVEGVLHGTYAYVGVAELWCSRMVNSTHETARDHFTRYRSWVREGLDALWRSQALTTDGERFVQGMRATADAWPEGV